MTAVETLRKAAEKLRSLAREAVPGPWEFSETQSNEAVVYQPKTLDDGTPYAHGLFEADWGTLADAEYIAAMHPGVGLAIADWLDHTARYVEVASDDGMYDAETFHSEALAVARAVLGKGS